MEGCVVEGGMVESCVVGCIEGGVVLLRGQWMVDDSVVEFIEWWRGCLVESVLSIEWCRGCLGERLVLLSLLSGGGCCYHFVEGIGWRVVLLSYSRIEGCVIEGWRVVLLRVLADGELCC